MNTSRSIGILMIGTLVIAMVITLSGCRNEEPEPTFEESTQQEEESEAEETESDPLAEEINERIQYVLYLKHQEHPFIFSDSHQINENDQRLEEKSLSEFVLNELINQEGIGELINPIPKDTKVLAVENKERTAIVNLSQEFVDNIQGTEEDIEATIAMIVNSLITLPENDRVRLLVEGDKIHKIGDLPIQNEYKFITTYYPDK